MKNNKYLNTLLTQELLFIIIENLSYQDFIILKLTNKKIYNLIKGYDDYIYKKYIRKLKCYKTEIIEILSNKSIGSLNYTLKKNNIPKQFRIHEYKIGVNNNDRIQFFHISFYYNGYHEIKIKCEAYYNWDDSDNEKITIVKLLYKKISFTGKVIFDEYSEFSCNCTHGCIQVEEFKHIQKYIPGINIIIKDYFLWDYWKPIDLNIYNNIIQNIEKFSFMESYMNDEFDINSED